MKTGENAGIAILDQGTGTPQYLIMDPHALPWVGDLYSIIDEPALNLDEADIFLITPEQRFARVAVTCTDGDPDLLDWEVTFADGGELIERMELDEHEPNVPSKAHRRSYVNGFLE